MIGPICEDDQTDGYEIGKSWTIFEMFVLINKISVKLTRGERIVTGSGGHVIVRACGGHVEGM